MTIHHDKREETWGSAATHSEYQVNDHIRYIVNEQIRIGTIYWTCAPASCAKQHLPTRYVVQPDDAEGCFDMVQSGNIVIDAAPEQEGSSHSTPTDQEQAFIDMLATLSPPIIIQIEMDDEGQPFYVWHVGASTPQRPFGLYVGTHRQFTGAVKLAMEKVIECVHQ